MSGSDLADELQEVAVSETCNTQAEACVLMDILQGMFGVFL